jgi:LemA protein
MSNLGNFVLVVILAVFVGTFLGKIAWSINIPVVVFLLVIWLISMYNSFISMINRVKEAWSDIEVQLKRRYDLIPNLVSTVKGYATHESTAFEKVTQARAAAMGAKTMGDHTKSEVLLSGAVSGIFGIAEAYPDLKANTNFIGLQNELSDTENKIQAARRFYNGNVRDFNTVIESFPQNLMAKIFSFTKQEFFELDQDQSAAKEPVAVKF